MGTESYGRENYSARWENMAGLLFFEKNVLRLGSNESRNGFFRRGRARSLHVEGILRLTSWVIKYVNKVSFCFVLNFRRSRLFICLYYASWFSVCQPTYIQGLTGPSFDLIVPFFLSSFFFFFFYFFVRRDLSSVKIDGSVCFFNLFC